MADLEEDEVRIAPPDPTEIDLSDETQDFRFLSTLTGTDHPTIPRRGEKDFEPHGTAHQAALLAASRDAMHAALSSTRVHLPKSHVLGHWYAARSQCAVPRPRGSLFKTMGRAARDGVTWLLPEEMLYLLERGGLDVRWGGGEERAGGEEEGEGEGLRGKGWRKEKGEGEDEGERGEIGEEGEGQTGGQGIPMSLQGAYAVCIGDEASGKIGLERWNVYAGLKRSGYVVMRAPTWTDESEDHDDDEGDKEAPSSPPIQTHSTASQNALSPHGLPALFDRILTSIFPKGETDPPPAGPLVAPGLYRSYNQIYRLLSAIPSHDPTLAASSPATTATATAPAFSTPPPSTVPFRVAFHVWKPQPDFKKSMPGPPDYRIAVVSARDDPLPTLSQISALMASTPYQPPPEHMGGPTKSIARLKHGYRNVLLAVVDAGVVSYLRISDAAFAKEKMYERPKGVIFFYHLL
ncbi:MAG: tRNA-splicing endonuclease subunit sen54 [Thelocarpon superellum]|nr:MAG: tRNA-splicing endonuclease subunit sen54 [Thelocarpon superellum]